MTPFPCHTESCKGYIKSAVLLEVSSIRASAMLLRAVLLEVSSIRASAMLLRAMLLRAVLLEVNNKRAHDLRVVIQVCILDLSEQCTYSVCMVLSVRFHQNVQSQVMLMYESDQPFSDQPLSDQPLSDQPSSDQPF